ncbi:hypothetical protein SAMN05216584_104193 [Selenomonas sp. WCT3]|uniref:DUF342 domain-containing protein n=1 Tax=unclassified Selenomonas TaxID=2637378 RepID=UPI00088F4A25|nr:FapA family protein [Selenomonas sp.]MCR5439968.1 FapA family protein [Selenomonas sp.]SDG37462.1 hypothetical protein SAMN05216584_104193 [Selenomonas ruminantium]
MDDQTLRPAVGSKEAGYLCEFREDGVYLTIYPDAADGLLFELSDIRQILHDNGVIDYDIITLSQIVREASGESKKLADCYISSEEAANLSLQDEGITQEENEAEAEAGLIVDVSRDRMTVTIRYDTKIGKRLPSVDTVRAALADHNIVFGIDDEAIRVGVESLNPFVAATGKPPKNGENARIERHFDLGVKGRPKVDQYDRVDFKDMNLFVLAKKGDLLAVRIPQTEGEAGRDVYGMEVPAKNGKPIPIPQGKNTEISGENDLIASIDGQIVDSGKKITIDPHLLIQGSVDVGTGNIDFMGSVEIKGNVEAGFVVKATGDIEIGGMVSGGDVEGRNVYIQGGVNGMNRGKVKAREDVRAAFAENAVIESERDIYIQDVALHSNISAGKRIFLEDKRGMITGGLVEAGEEIRCKIVGNTAFVVTRLAVGVNPQLQKRYRELCQEYKDSKQRLKQITQMLNTLGKIDISRLPQERINQINALTRSQFPLAGKIKRDEKEILAIETELNMMQNGKIRVSDTVYPGVRISINSVMMNVQSEIKRATLAVKNDRVDIGPY